MKHYLFLLLAILALLLPADAQSVSDLPVITVATVDPSTNLLMVTDTSGETSKKITLGQMVNIPGFFGAVSKSELGSSDDVTGTFSERSTTLADAALSIAKTSGLQTALDAKAPKAIFATVDDLRANNDAALECATVRNHSDPADQGGGVFIKASGLAKTDDDGAVIEDANGAVWIRKEFLNNINETNPVWWGAIAYFNFFYGPATPSVRVTDASGAFQAANDALPTAHPYTGNPSYPGYLTTSGRLFRTGKIKVPTGQFWLGSTIYLSPMVRIEGDGFLKTMLIRLPNTAGLGTGEKFMLDSEDLVSPLNNNNFGNSIQDISVCGNTSPANANGNQRVSGVRWRGAQGSFVRRVQVANMGMRGLVNYGCQVEDVWLEGTVRGPAYHDFTGGYGVRHKNLSIEHNNLSGTYTLADDGYGDGTIEDGALRIPSVIVETATGITFEDIAFEESPFDMYLRNTVRSKIINMRGNTPTGASCGIRLGGNCYENDFENIQSGIWTETIRDEST